ncbi:hypothetical protein SAMN05660766_1251 [Curtobacterium sp. 314Chir4.1]|uniref:hypothetical protein n=1 Tax=Curtobacterium sp. 314Chir4.1 TaxID=1279028 RepID=UPI000BC65781|nr:hypothetical protein [Curtobacterium sp. 314Chir4.1]SOC87569.1 hypothetical protein SAMN05660766_1251 [Curtobacterium sp. 314Chir4.1]
MNTTTEFAVHTGDRCTAMEVAGAALRQTGHHVESTGGTITATSGSRLLTILLGALVHPSREFRRYELSTTVTGTSTTITLRHAGHATAVSGGGIGADRRRSAWQQVNATLERALRSAGVLAAHPEHRPF